MHRLFIRRCEKPTVAFFVRWKRGKHGHRSCPKPAWMLFPVSRRSQTSTQCPHVAALATPRSVTHMMRSCQLAAAGTVARAHCGQGATAGGCCIGAGVERTRGLLQKDGACKGPRSATCCLATAVRLEMLPSVPPAARLPRVRLIALSSSGPSESAQLVM